MNVLGVSAFYHDSAACLVLDGKIVAAAQEERFTRVRFDASFPLNAIRSCLQIAGLSAHELDLVAFYEKPLLRFDRAMATFLETFPTGRRAFVRTAPAWMRERVRLPRLLEDEIGWRGRIVYVAHHEAHAASAYLASPFDEAAILTVDGVGEWTTNAIGRGRNGDVTLLRDMVFPHSLGLFYAAITEYLGFEVLADEYKVMGLAPYGEPRFTRAIFDRMVDLRDDGSYRLDMRYFRFLEGERTIDQRRFAGLFDGPPRRADGGLDDRHADVAASAQAVLEEVLLRQARHARTIVDVPNLVLAGGVALNAAANGRLAREAPFDRVWVQPAAGDAGGAIGAALLATHRILGLVRTALPDDGMSGALLGPDFDRDHLLHAAQSRGLASRELDDDELDAEVARRLARGEVVGWFQGRMEFGPRALGSRSILADPRRPDAQRRVNERIKFREGFRPFAPAVLDVRAKEFFDIEPPSPYMLFIAPLAQGQRVECAVQKGLAKLGSVVSTIPGVTHVDGTARVQTVDAHRNPRFHGILTAFERLTGCPILLNTSFNLRGEPIVCTPEDALGTFLASGMNAIALGPLLIDHPPGPPLPLAPPPPPIASHAQARSFARDTAIASLVGMTIAAACSVRRGSAGLAVLAAVLATVAVCVAGARLLRPQALTLAATLWRPIGDVLGSGVSFVAFSIVYFTILGPIALLRRARGSALWTPPSLRVPSYWQAPESPRGAPDRMY